ncbi:type I DNA topoisomerase [Aggregatilinea lenta]|uniref:type I DNA topoisomerase n=1 Tax=Aggregatilinea lenta TaxID=913108 RepID=UPI000E5ADF3B|nr:type I DNA topoisomerase [Aggregatilinea lenta]
MSKLVIVESPTKARTIREFLPKDYQVEASMGHIRDLPASAAEIPPKLKGEEWARLGVNVGQGFEPLYVISRDKKKVVRDLTAALKSADELILATDEDREGESIAWHLMQVLKPRIPIKRMVFHEITREAIQDALKKCRTIDSDLVEAQETRRILDRLVGYTVSPLLWKKVAPGLSAGRVQSAAVRLLVQREQDRRGFHSGSYWDLKATIEAHAERFTAQLVTLGGVRLATGADFDESTGRIPKGKKVVLLEQQQAADLRDRLLKGAWSVKEVNEREQERTPAPPFTTSTLQMEANRKLGMSARETMQVAQRLYEQGYITYMRTDSVHLSKQALGTIRQCVMNKYGQDYLSPTPRQFRTKSKGAQEAHEAIRPAGQRMPTAEELHLSGQEFRLYDLIWKRAIATQMANAKLKLSTVTLAVEDAEFRASGKRVVFPGFFRAYVEGADDPSAALDDQETILPPLKQGEPVDCRALDPMQHDTKPPARYTDATLVKELESNGIGRPSTYATIISTIQDRGYVVKQGNQLIPTFTAFAVNHLMEEHFPELVDTQFTARVEQVLDDIASGGTEGVPYLESFYLGERGLDQQVKAKEIEIDPREIHALEVQPLSVRVRIGPYGPYLEYENNGDLVRVSLPEAMPPGDLVDEEIRHLLRQKEEGPQPLGHHPESGEPVFALIGPYGPYVQLGENGESGTNGKGAKPRRVSLPKNLKPETIALDQAIALLELPRNLGPHPDDGKAVEAGIGRFGPFVRHDGEYRSLTKTDDVLKVGLPRALDLLAQEKGRRKVEMLRELGEHPEGGVIGLFEGRYGPYVKHGKVNASLPKAMSAQDITLEQALALLSEKQAKKPAANKGAKSTRKSTSKSTPKTAPKTTSKSKSSTSAASKTGTKAAPKSTAKKKTASTSKTSKTPNKKQVPQE